MSLSLVWMASDRFLAHNPMGLLASEDSEAGSPSPALPGARHEKPSASGVGTTAETKKVVIPFDFISKYDDGRQGAKIGEMVWKKLQREGGYVLPESMIEVREYCAGHSLKPSPETSLDSMRKIVCEDFDAQIGIWGSVERVENSQADRYDLTMKCVDFSANPPKVLYDIQARTESASEIPHRYIKDMVDALCGRTSQGTGSSDPFTTFTVEKYWSKNPNLVVGGDFEEGDDGVPKGWENVAGQLREPLGSQVEWASEAEHPENKVIRFTLAKEVAESEGVMYYSQFFPIEEGTKYRFQCRWRSNNPDVKVFIKCYDEVDPARAQGEQEKRQKTAAPSTSQSSEKGNIRREVYRSQQNLKGEKNVWNVHAEDFTPKHTEYSPRWGRVMLYAYLRPGVVEFDDVVVKKIGDAPSPGEVKKVRRHSSETKITIEQMEANERRSKAKQTEKSEEGKNMELPSSGEER